MHNKTGRELIQKANEAVLNEGIQKMIDVLPSYMAIQAVLAKQTKIRYDSFLAEGFTEQQALILCKENK